MRARAGRLADGDPGGNSRFAIDCRAAALESRAGGLRRDDVDLAAGKNARAFASTSSTDRSGFAATGIRALVRSVGLDRARAQTFRRTQRPRRGTAPHLSRPDDARFSRGHEPDLNQRIRMSAPDAAGECISRTSARGLGGRAARSSGDWPLRLCRRNFIEHALRHRRDLARIDFARRHHLFLWLSSLDSASRNGVFASAFLFGGAGTRPFGFWTTEHGRRRVLRDSGRLGRRFRNSYLWALPASADRQRIASRCHRHLGCKTWTRRFFRRAHNRCRLSRACAERFDGLLTAWCADRHRHFLCRSLHVHDFVSLHSRTTGATPPRLGFRDRQKICAVERAASCAGVDFLDRDFVPAERNRVFARSSTSLRGKHAFTRAEKQPRQSRVGSDHAQNADALGTSPGDCAGARSARTARRLARNLRALERAPSCGQNQKLLHARSALSFTELDAKKSRTLACN